MVASACLDVHLKNSVISTNLRSSRESTSLQAQFSTGGLRLNPLQGKNWNVCAIPKTTLRSPAVVRSGLFDIFHADLLRFDKGTWLNDVEKYGAIAFYSPPEGGAEGRYATALKNQGYRLMNISARGLGDPEAYLTKIHGVRPPHLGKQAVARWYLPPEIDYRLSLIHKDDKGLVLWVGEGKVLAKNELQFFALLPALRPNLKVVVEMGGARKFEYRPLKDVSGLPASSTLQAAEVTPEPKKEETQAEVVTAN